MHLFEGTCKNPQDIFIHRYELRGNWGDLELPSYASPGLADFAAEANNAMQSLRGAFSSMAGAFPGPITRAKETKRMLDASEITGEIEKAIESLNPGATGPLAGELREGRELAQREDLTDELIYWGIKPDGARWLANKWPAVLLTPDNTWAWVQAHTMALGARLRRGLGLTAHYGAGATVGLSNQLYRLAKWAGGSE